jgi:hypothetical protein
MNKEVFEKIISEVKDINDLPNNRITDILDLLSEEFESVKNNLIKTTYYLDTIEELYNRLNKEYQKRNL